MGKQQPVSSSFTTPTIINIYYGQRHVLGLIYFYSFVTEHKIRIMRENTVIGGTQQKIMALIIKVLILSFYQKLGLPCSMFP
jgi:hypothetical protein